jgi:hypothetical protein
MIKEICSIGIIIILVLPFILKGIFQLNDYFGYIMGIRFLIISCIAQPIFNFIVPISSYKENSNLELDKLLNLSMKERVLTWLMELLSSILTLLILSYCVSQIAKPTQNSNTVFLFISGICIQYIFPFALYLILPVLSRNEKFLAIIEKHKMNKEYFTGEFLVNSLKKTLSLVMNDFGMSLLLLFYHKNLISKGFCYLNYFLPKIVRFLILCCGLKFFDNCFNLSNALPLAFGLYYFCKFAGSGQLNVKYKDDSEFE